MNRSINASPPAEGYSPWEALGLLLAACDKAPEPHLTLAELATGDIQDALVSELERHGLLARWTHLDPSALSSLALPSLALRADGSCWLLLSQRNGRILVQAPQGRQYLRIESFPMEIFLDLAPALPVGNLWQCLWISLLAQRKPLLLVIAAALIVQVVALLTPQFTRVLVDKVFPQSAKSMFAVVLTASTFLGVYQAWVGWLQSRFEHFLETRLGFVAEQGLMAHLLRLPYRWTSSRTTGDLLQGFFGLQAAKSLLTGNILSALVNGIAAFGYLALMMNVLPGATLWVVGLTLCSLAITVLVGLHILRLQNLAVEAQIRERGYLVEILNGVAVFKASGAENLAECRWMNLVRKRRRLDLRSQRTNLSTLGLLNLIQILSTQVLTVWGGYQVMQGHLRLGEMLAFTMMAGSLQQAISQTSSVYIQLAMLNPHLAKVRDILETHAEPVPTFSPGNALKGPICLKDLWFRYGSDQPWVLENLNLRITPGERVVLRGPSGCGKSTILKLVADLYVPDRGLITIGGSLPSQAKATFSYLPQTVKLFNASIIENLRLLSGGAARDALVAAAEGTGLSELVAALPMGFETMVCQGGGNFSGGQRQLIALTAVIASARQVILLDEAMANIDPIAKERLFARDLFRDKTVLLASHEDLMSPLGPENHGFRRVLLSCGVPGRI